jgi:hypothetical protein
VRSLKFSCGCDTLNGFAKLPLLNIDMALRIWVFLI